MLVEIESWRDAPSRFGPGRATVIGTAECVESSAGDWRSITNTCLFRTVVEASSLGDAVTFLRERGFRVAVGWQLLSEATLGAAAAAAAGFSDAGWGHSSVPN